tara:strand:- start:472 stop:714 length:243 start_codon:yes stop_codon:yes gene_type:complete
MAASSLVENLPPTAEGAAVALAARGGEHVLVPPPLCIDTAYGATLVTTRTGRVHDLPEGRLSGWPCSFAFMFRLFFDILF